MDLRLADLLPYLQIQNIALRVLRDIAAFIEAGKTERDVAVECASLLEKYGARESWYHDIPALVLVGDRTTLSASGRDYQPSDLAIRNDDLVTIDLSPMLDGCWGDCARSYIVESGRIIAPGQSSPIWHGIVAETWLHTLLTGIATPQTTIHELYTVMNQAIEEKGYQNLDFRGNLGHTIEKHLDDRRYIESDNPVRLGECDLFTFEPHISKTNDNWGFKMENVYYFENGRAVPLGSPELLWAVS